MHVNKLIREYDIVVPSIKAPAKSLSGGNQQKLLIARELSRMPDFILAVQPTRGLDIAATNYVRRLLIDLRNQGKAILLITTDVDEALEISDVLAVIFEGRLLSIDRADRYDEKRLGLLMGGVEI